MSDYYKTLGVLNKYPKMKLKESAKKLAKEHRPDLNGGDDTQFKKINEANDTLSDDKKTTI